MATLSASPAEPIFAAFAAIDWASKEHVVAIVPAAGGRIEINTLKNTPEAVELWAADLRRRSSLIERATAFADTLVILVKEIGTDALFALHRGVVCRGVEPTLRVQQLPGNVFGFLLRLA